MGILFAKDPLVIQSQIVNRSGYLYTITINQKGKEDYRLFSSLDNSLIYYNTVFLGKCKNDHNFKITAEEICDGKWCSECDTLYYLQLKNIAKTKGGILLSRNYLGYYDNTMKWECKNHHVFLASPYAIKKLNKWCTICSRIDFEKDDKLDLNINIIQNYGEK